MRGARGQGLHGRRDLRRQGQRGADPPRRRPSWCCSRWICPPARTATSSAASSRRTTSSRAVPIVIIGNPDGFAAHRKLKTPRGRVRGQARGPAQLVEKVGALIGLPEVAAGETVVDESLSLNELVDETGARRTVAEEIAVETGRGHRARRPDAGHARRRLRRHVRAPAQHAPRTRAAGGARPSHGPSRDGGGAGARSAQESPRTTPSRIHG